MAVFARNENGRKLHPTKSEPLRVSNHSQNSPGGKPPTAAPKPHGKHRALVVGNADTRRKAAEILEALDAGVPLSEVLGGMPPERWEEDE